MKSLREEKEKKNRTIQRKKKKLLEELKESKIFSQTYILYNISGVLKQTFLGELGKFTNIYSQFTIFCEKNNRNFKSFTIDNKKIFFQLKNDYKSEKGSSLSLSKLDESPANLFSNKISTTFVVKLKKKKKKDRDKKYLQL